MEGEFRGGGEEDSELLQDQFVEVERGGGEDVKVEGGEPGGVGTEDGGEEFIVCAF